MIVELIIIFLISAMCFLFDYSDYYDSTNGYPKLKFKSFLSFYTINQERWKLNYNTVECILKSSYGGLFEKTEKFCFSYIDTLRYHHWHKNLDKHAQSQSHAKITAQMIAAVKEDIAKTESLAKQEQAEAINIIRSIQNDRI